MSGVGPGQRSARSSPSKSAAVSGSRRPRSCLRLPRGSSGPPARPAIPQASLRHAMSSAAQSQSRAPVRYAGHTAGSARDRWRAQVVQASARVVQIRTRRDRQHHRAAVGVSAPVSWVTPIHAVRHRALLPARLARSTAHSHAGAARYDCTPHARRAVFPGGQVISSRGGQRHCRRAGRGSAGRHQPSPGRRRSRQARSRPLDVRPVDPLPSP